jgi:hypothetical protein
MKFIIEERIPCVQVWIYEIEANSETEALEAVLEGNAQVVDSLTDDHDYESAQYEIEDEDGNGYSVERDNDNTQDNDEDEYDGASWDMQAR